MEETSDWFHGEGWLGDQATRQRTGNYPLEFDADKQPTTVPSVRFVGEDCRDEDRDKGGDP